MEEKQNICLMNDSFPPTIDGVANAVLNYAEIIERSHGHSIVVTPQYPGVQDAYSFPVVRYRSFDTTRLVGYRTGYPFSASALGVLEQENINLIHAHCPIVSTALARVLRERINAPVVLTYHTKFDIDIANVVESEHLRRTAEEFLVNNIAACDEVWAVSRGAGENLRKLGYGGDYVIMENGTDMKKGAAAPETTDALDTQYDLPKNVPVFLFVGRMMWYKGIRIILDALAALKTSGTDFRMAFVGGGGNLQEIQTYAGICGVSDRCVFAGPVAHDALKAWYSRADLFLFPSTFDTNGLVVREAAACGLASVLVRGSCAAEGVTEGVNGFLIDENAAALLRMLQALLASPEKMQSAGTHAMEELYLSWEDSVARAYDRYMVVLENYRTSGVRRPPVRHDRFFSTMAALCDGVEKARAYYRALERRP